MNQFRGVAVALLLAVVPEQLNGGMGLGFLPPEMMAGLLVVFKQNFSNVLFGDGHRKHDEKMGLLYAAGSPECEPRRSSPALTVARQSAGGGAAGGSGAPAGVAPLHPHGFPLFDEAGNGAASPSSEKSRPTAEDEAALELSAAFAALVADEVAEAGDAVTPLEKTRAAVTKMQPAFTRSTLPSRYAKEEWTMGKGTPAACRDSALLSPTVGASLRRIPTLKTPLVLDPSDFVREFNGARYGNIASMLRLSDYYWQLMEVEGDKNAKKRQEFYEKALTSNMRAFILIEIDLDLRVRRTTISDSEKLAIMTRLSLCYKKYSDEEFSKGPRSSLLVRIRSDIFLNIQEQVDSWYALTGDWLVDLFDHAEPFALTREQISVRPAQWGSVLWSMLTYD